MDWEGSEKVNVNVLKDNLVCRMSFLHNDFYRPSTWQGRHFFCFWLGSVSNLPPQYQCVKVTLYQKS